MLVDKEQLVYVIDNWDGMTFDEKYKAFVSNAQTPKHDNEFYWRLAQDFQKGLYKEIAEELRHLLAFDQPKIYLTESEAISFELISLIAPVKQGLEKQCRYKAYRFIPNLCFTLFIIFATYMAMIFLNLL